MGRPWYEHMLTPDWMMHDEDYDDIRRQEAKTASLEYRMEKMEQRVEDMQKHIRGLEALLAQHGIVPPTPEDSETLKVASPGSKKAGKPILFPARTEENITCPLCGRKQKGNRNACYSCGTPFLYENE